MPPRTKPRLFPLTAAWLRYLSGFTVSVGIGLAPYLGRANVPLFTPVLSLIPLSLQDIAIPVSTAFMGIIAVWIQWHKQDKPTSSAFAGALATSTLALVALIGTEVVAVAHPEIPAVGKRVSFAVGFSSTAKPPCESFSKEACITQKLGLNEATIDSHYGDVQTGLAKMALLLSYVCFMSFFGLMVGLLLLKEQGEHAGND